ncbi:toxin-activating lysine-acyltransferase [Methylovirgula sp. 4M-Z18]|nr:toxin-activating lysine-acyltransferase [Methylovirgula sp. 4M-Z18]
MENDGSGGAQNMAPDAEPPSLKTGPATATPDLTIDQVHIGAALSRLFAASLGDAIMVMSQSSHYKHCALSDIEWLLLPPARLGQIYIAEMAHREKGFRKPIALLTWAFVSEEVDQRLQQDLRRPARLRPEEWNSGDIGWIIDAVGGQQGIESALTWLKHNAFKGHRMKMTVFNAHGAAHIAIVEGASHDT